MNLTDLKSRIDIIDVLEKLGARFEERSWAGWDDEFPVYCPFCEDIDSRKPAGRANVLKNLYFCFNCGVGGDIISITQEHIKRADRLPATFNDAVSWLTETFGVDDAA